MVTRLRWFKGAGGEGVGGFVAKCFRALALASAQLPALPHASDHRACGAELVRFCCSAEQGSSESSNR